MTSQPRDKTRDSTKHDTAKFGIDLYSDDLVNDILLYISDLDSMSILPQTFRSFISHSHCIFHFSLHFSISCPLLIPLFILKFKCSPLRAERQRTIYSYAYNDILKTQNLCKVYKKNKVVVNRLAFSVSPGIV